MLVSPGRRIGLVTLVVCVALGAVALDALAFLGPLLVLAGCLCARWYPGEAQLIRRIAPRRCGRARSRTAVANRPSVRCVPRGGLLLAFSLAVRPPPLPLR
jgi:hypothetical protein